jgi:hypothetical protein
MDQFALSRSHYWPAVEWTGSYAGPDDVAVLDNTTIFDVSGSANPMSASFGWSLNWAGRTFALTCTPVPEPEALAMLSAVGVINDCTTRYRFR